MPESERQEGLELLRVAVKTCHMQIKSGGSFILEHPVGASSWQSSLLVDLGKVPGVSTFVLDQCMYGLESRDREGVGPARKTTRIITNLCGAEKYLTTRCDRSHRHVELLNGRAKAAQIYPQKLCMAFLKALKLHLQLAENARLEALLDPELVTTMAMN